MVLTQILQPTCVIAPLKGQDKESVITELVDVLAANGHLADRDEVLRSVLMREATRSTGIGQTHVCLEHFWLFHYRIK